MRKINNKAIGIIVMLLLLPFRLPINVLIIKIITYTSSIGIKLVPIDMLAMNVAITKGIYNALLSALLLSSIIEYIIDKLQPENKDDVKAPVIVLGVCLLSSYLIYDCISVYELTKIILK